MTDTVPTKPHGAVRRNGTHPVRAGSHGGDDNRAATRRVSVGMRTEESRRVAIVRAVLTVVLVTALVAVAIAGATYVASQVLIGMLDHV